MQLIKNNKGQAILEFALVLPVFLLLVFGIIDMSRLAYHKILLNQAAKEATRIASVGNNLSSITQRIKDLTYPLTGNVTESVVLGIDDLGNSCTIITLKPVSGSTLKTYITPSYTNRIKVGSSLRIVIFFDMDYITPLTTILGQSTYLKAQYYARVENPPM